LVVDNPIAQVKAGNGGELQGIRQYGLVTSHPTLQGQGSLLTHEG
jgi:hypothetical protein